MTRRDLIGLMGWIAAVSGLASISTLLAWIVFGGGLFLLAIAAWKKRL